MNDIECLKHLYPQVVSTKNDKAFDVDGEEVVYDKAAVQALVDSHAYQAQRSAEYPSVIEQLDTLYHEGYDGWKAQIQAVKERFPK